MKDKRKYLLIILIAFILFGIGFYLFKNKNSDYLLDMKIDGNNNVTNPINYEEVINDLKVKYNNDDVVGILEIDNTDYIVPVVQGEDNDYYLNHTPDRKENFMGSIYLDYRVDINSSPKLLIFGHNSSNIDMPFKILEEFYDKDYYDNHKYMWLTTDNVKKKYEVFSVYVETSDFSYMNIKFKNNEEWLDHLKKLKSNSMYDTGVDITSNDEILILQTCSTHSDYSNYQKKYLLVILKRIL